MKHRISSGIDLTPIVNCDWSIHTIGEEIR